MTTITRQDVSRAIAQLMPRIIQGIQLDVFVQRGVTQTQFLVLMALHGYAAKAVRAERSGLTPIAPGIPCRHDGGDFTGTGGGPAGERSECTMGTLARNLHVRMPTATGIVSRLVRAGYVRRHPKPEDRRQIVVTLTPKGYAFIQAFQAVVRHRWEEVLRSLKPTELATFHRVVTKLHGQL